MASRLVNLRYTLTWNDFQGHVPAGETLNALTDVEMVFSGFGVEHRDGGVTLRDSLVITVTLRRNRSWARAGAARTAALLNHEQGHYNITALTSRDLFIDLMALKARTFANAGALQTELNRVRGNYDPQAIHDKYDERTEADHGRDVAGQRRWDGYIQRAFTVPRTPPVNAPDGTAYKLRLRDVLQAAGHLPS